MYEDFDSWFDRVRPPYCPSEAAKLAWDEQQRTIDALNCCLREAEGTIKE